MDLLSLLYLAFGLICAMAYIPQIRALLRDHSGAMAVSLSTYTAWTCGSIVALLYSIEHLNDGYAILIAALGVAGNVAVLSLAVYKRFHMGRI